MYVRDHGLEQWLEGNSTPNDRGEITGDPRFWFQIDAGRKSPTSPLVPGRGLVIGVREEGIWTDAHISLVELTARVTFSRRKLRGMTTSATIMTGRGLERAGGVSHRGALIMSGANPRLPRCAGCAAAARSTIRRCLPRVRVRSVRRGEHGQELHLLVRMRTTGPENSLSPLIFVESMLERMQQTYLRACDELRGRLDEQATPKARPPVLWPIKEGARSRSVRYSADRTGTAVRTRAAAEGRDHHLRAVLWPGQSHDRHARARPHRSRQRHPGPRLPGFGDTRFSRDGQPPARLRRPAFEIRPMPTPWVTLSMHGASDFA